MFLLTLLGGLLALTSLVALAYAFRTAADGQEDEIGFHYSGAPARMAVSEATVDRHEQAHAATVIHSRPAA